MKKKRFLFWFLLVNILLLGFAFLVLFSYKSGICGIFGGCPFVKLFHIYCPFCGCTRAAVALLSGDVPLSVRCNPTTLTLAAVTGYLEISAILYLITEKNDYRRRLKPQLLYIPAAIALLFCLYRNIAVLYGYDFLGDLLPG